MAVEREIVDAIVDVALWQSISLQLFNVNVQPRIVVT